MFNYQEKVKEHDRIVKTNRIIIYTVLTIGLLLFLTAGILILLSIK